MSYIADLPSDLTIVPASSRAIQAATPTGAPRGRPGHFALAQSGHVATPDPRHDLARRAFDIAVSCAGLAVTWPLLLLIALMVKLDSPGPALYRQERIGLYGRPFTILKFRSMRVDAEAGGPRWADEHDHRVTRFGRLLRLTRLDESPQLLNVLAGSMSLIGPRPERLCFARQISRVVPGFDARNGVKPGITGWAQVNFRYGSTVEDARVKLSYDIYYIENRSLKLDLRILLATVGVILGRKGAR